MVFLGLSFSVFLVRSCFFMVFSGVVHRFPYRDSFVFLFFLVFLRCFMFFMFFFGFFMFFMIFHVFFVFSWFSATLDPSI